MKFLVTEDCGRLARWLRLLGFDAVWIRDAPVTECYRRAYNERRVIVTRNRRLRASDLFHVVHLTSATLEEQLRQLVNDLKLALDDERLFTRCDRCNVPVKPIEKTAVKDRIPPYVFEHQAQFYTCPSCQRIYWAATHWDRVKQLLARVNPAPRPNGRGRGENPSGHCAIPPRPDPALSRKGGASVGRGESAKRANRLTGHA